MRSLNLNSNLTSQTGLNGYLAIFCVDHVGPPGEVWEAWKRRPGVPVGRVLSEGSDQLLLTEAGFRGVSCNAVVGFSIEANQGFAGCFPAGLTPQSLWLEQGFDRSNIRGRL